MGDGRGGLAPHGWRRRGIRRRLPHPVLGGDRSVGPPGANSRDSGAGNDARAMIFIGSTDLYT
jgi:hypothetical protein